MEPVQIPIGLLLVMWVVNRIVSQTQRAQGQRRCVNCHARLKFVGVGSARGTRPGFGTTCAKCGREQPWS